VTQEANDKRQVAPMMEQVEQNLGEKPGALLADNGYYSQANVEWLRAQGIDDYLCPDRLKHGEKAPEVRGRIPKDLSFIDRVRRKLRTKKGQETYGRRKGIVEPTFGCMKHVRGLAQYLLRGVEKWGGEWLLEVHYAQRAETLACGDLKGRRKGKSAESWPPDQA